MTRETVPARKPRMTRKRREAARVAAVLAEISEEQAGLAAMSPWKRRQWLQEMERLDALQARARRNSGEQIVPLTQRFHPREDLDV